MKNTLTLISLIFISQAMFAQTLETTNVVRLKLERTLAIIDSNPDKAFNGLYKYRHEKCFMKEHMYFLGVFFYSYSQKTSRLSHRSHGSVFHLNKTKYKEKAEKWLSKSASLGYAYAKEYLEDNSLQFNKNKKIGTTVSKNVSASNLSPPEISIALKIAIQLYDLGLKDQCWEILMMYHKSPQFKQTHTQIYEQLLVEGYQ